MIYFFTKGREFVRCEIHPGRPNLFRIVSSSGEESVERYHSAADMESRWHEVSQKLTYDGWTGPFGHDGRA